MVRRRVGGLEGRGRLYRGRNGVAGGGGGGGRGVGGGGGGGRGGVVIGTQKTIISLQDVMINSSIGRYT